MNQDFPDIKYPINRETIGQIMGISTDKVRDMLNEIGVPKILYKNHSLNMPDFVD